MQKAFRLTVSILLFATLAGCASSAGFAKRTVAIKEVQASEQLNEHQMLATQGIQLLTEGDVEEASDNFNKALRLNPMETDYHLLNAVTYHVEAINGNAAAYEMAQQGYEMSIRFDPSNWLAYYLLGRLHLERNEFPQAMAMFSEALLLESSEPELLKSMAYASYRSGDAVTAVAMIERLESLDAISTNKDIQNAALIYAAVGQQERSEDYLKQLMAQDTKGWRSKHIQRRVDDWKQFYNQPSLKKAAWGSGSSGGSSWGSSGSSGSSWGSSSTSTGGAATTSGGGDGNDKKMVVVDVVIIRTEETIGTSKGLNLLNGLKLQFGSQGAAAWSDGRNIQRAVSTTVSDAAALTESTTRTVTDTITNAVSIPGLTYSLNIFNTSNQRNEILARPSIVAMAGQRSEFFSGVELNAAAVSEGQNGQSVQIQKEIGVKLGVTPQILEDGRVQLEVQAERTFLKTPNSDVNFTFRIETSKTTVNANVVMRYGETLILSGLSEKESENARDGTPLLQDIPILQYFFSERKTLEFQKSVLILLTPRPAQYVYQPEKAREEYEKSLSDDERPIANLRARYSDWFKPYPNWASVFKHMQNNGLYREFRTGDVELEQWNSNTSLQNRLKQSLDFLWY